MTGSKRITIWQTASDVLSQDGIGHSGQGQILPNKRKIITIKKNNPKKSKNIFGSIHSQNEVSPYIN